MNRNALSVSALVAGLTMAMAPAASACGEGQFNMGQGLKYQTYLTPRPATVLVYATDSADPSPARRQALISGLRASGHTVTEVHDDAALAQALKGKRFDVLIAAYANIDKVAADASAAGSTVPTLLPVVERRMRNAPSLSERFSHFVLEGASLGQYLKTINSALPASAP